MPNQPEHLTPQVSSRGFAHLPPLAGTYHGDQVRVYESSAADGPQLPDPPPPEKPVDNAGTITILAAFIDYCGDNGVKFPKQLRGQYAKRIKEALDDGFEARQVKQALAAMFDERVANRPSLLPNKLVELQTGPERTRQNIQWGQQDHPDGTGAKEHDKTPTALANLARDECETARAEGRLTWAHILREEFYEALAETDPKAEAENIVDDVTRLDKQMAETALDSDTLHHDPDGSVHDYRDGTPCSPAPVARDAQELEVAWLRDALAAGEVAGDE